VTILQAASSSYDTALTLPAAQQPDHPILIIGAQQMASAVRSSTGRAILAEPGSDVPFVRGAISDRQFANERVSYVNAVLIQSRGFEAKEPCARCRTTGFRPFPTCRKHPAHFGGCCGNCKWPDFGKDCTIAHHEDEEDVELIWESHTGGTGGDGGGASGAGAARALPSSGGSAVDPIVLPP
jgi:hypothetical protein